MAKQGARQSELSVWTDIDPAHEEDFNLWYDREHMEERVSIPGFRWARRYRAVRDDVRRYLALYRTEGPQVFTSPAYRQAFQNQTEWSNRNFERMRNTQRRVSEVTQTVGLGYGGALALAVLPEGSAASSLPSALDDLRREPGVLGGRLLTPDPELSTPLPSEDRETRRLEPLLLIEAATEAAAADALDRLLSALSLPADRGFLFRLLWGLEAEERTL